ncbi:hypothetical protein FRC01_005264, partial [Tulasnella sp. 417]
MEALTDTIPFASIQAELQVMLALGNGKAPAEASNISSFPLQLKNLLTNCWSQRQVERPAAVDCLGIIESTQLELGVDETLFTAVTGSVMAYCGSNTRDELTSRPPKEIQGPMGRIATWRLGRPTGVAIEDARGLPPADAITSDPVTMPGRIIADRTRLQDSSILHQQLYGELGATTSRRNTLGSVSAKKRSHPRSLDDAGSPYDVEGERLRKRIRADAGPAALSTSAAPMEDRSVEDLATVAIDPARGGYHAGRGGEAKELGELQEDREMSPMSTQAVRAQSSSGQQLERWPAVGQQREFQQREDELRANSGPRMQDANYPGLVELKSDQFRYYSTQGSGNDRPRNGYREGRHGRRGSIKAGSSSEGQSGQSGDDSSSRESLPTPPEPPLATPVDLGLPLPAGSTLGSS